MSSRLLTRRALTIALAALTVQVSRRRMGQTQARERIGALVGATILTVTRGTIENGTIVLREGRIVALGARVDIPAGAEVIDVSGRFITPGLIDAHSHIAADAIHEGGSTVSSMIGKIANLIVIDGDLFDEKTRIRHVFVDGRPNHVEEEQPAGGRRGGRGSH